MKNTTSSKLFEAEYAESEFQLEVEIEIESTSDKV
jgi:hypothetical protein